MKDTIRRASVALAALVALAGSASTAGAAVVTHSPTTAPAMGSLSGTAYTFNTDRVIAGAEIRVAEHPDVVAVTAADGSYRLDVPTGPITPYIVAEGHETVYHQTFSIGADVTAPEASAPDAPDAVPPVDGLDLEGVNFQTPDSATYEALRQLMTGLNGRDPLEGGCVIVTTVGDPRLVGMSFDDFIRFAPHGVAGATMVSKPQLPAPTYFNDSVIPDPAQAASSGDGGVIWTNVPTGVYRIGATHPDHDFATITATCEPGRVVNANPVWGVVALS